METFEVTISKPTTRESRLTAVVIEIKKHLDRQSPDQEPPYRSGNPFAWDVLVPASVFIPGLCYLLGMCLFLSPDDHWHIRRR